MIRRIVSAGLKFVLPYKGTKMTAMSDMVKYELTIEVDERAGGLVVALVGTLGSPDEVDQMEQALSSACLHRPAVLVVNLSGLTFISALGIGALVQWQRLVQSRVGPFRLVDPQPAVAEMFRRLGLLEVFEIHYTVEAALSA
jgi:anti-sigma B factor antagonist